MVGIGLAALVAILAIVVSVFAFASSGGSGATTTVVSARPPRRPPAAAAAGQGADAGRRQGRGLREVRQGRSRRCPAVPAGAVKKFTVDVFQHVTQVDPNLAPTEAWSYAVNGKAYRGTAASPPIVVNQGDKVQVTFVNGGSKAMAVNMAHSIDFHSAEVAPNKNYIDVAPGKKLTIDFVAKHPGVFMYHCATQPVLMHTSAGMMGMMVVKPRNLPPVDKELWLTQEEFYLGAPGKPADMAKMAAETPDVMAFNGYANQYKAHPITVRRGEKIRMYVLDAGPSKWSAFHVIGTVFDTHPRRGRGRATTPRRCPSRRARAAGSSSPSTTRATTRSSPTPSATWSRAPRASCTPPARRRSSPRRRRRRPRRARHGRHEGRRQRDAGRDVRQGRHHLGQGRQGDLRGQEHRRHHARAGDRGRPGQGAGRDARRVDASWPRARSSPAGAGDMVTADLKPGSYELVCFLPGHYAAGQKLAFQVK